MHGATMKIKYWLLLNCYCVNQQVQTARYNCSDVLVRQLLHVSCLTGPSLGSAYLHKTNFMLSTFWQTVL
jgi:hypothetical protein